MKTEKRTLLIDRIVWIIIIIGTFAGAWFSGERILFVAAAVLFALPAVSYGVSSLFLWGIRVSPAQPKAILKNETGYLNIGLHNITFMYFPKVDVLIDADENAVSISSYKEIHLSPFGRYTLKIPFSIEFRGHYTIGLKALQISDITGLFRLRRKFGEAAQIVALPGIADLSNFPLTMNLMTQASSRYDIRDEDYSTVSDIRQYLPTDSIKRVHWKLTAKRNEWLVKNFQSNALNLVSVILDGTRQVLPPREMLSLEDKIVENALGFAKFCLNRGMPVKFLSTDGQKADAVNHSQFEMIYKSASDLCFSREPGLDCRSILAQELNEATGYINAVILTPSLNAQLYERIANGINNGHYIAVLYFSVNDSESDDIYKLLVTNGIPCYLAGNP